MDVTRAIPVMALLLGAAGCEHLSDRQRISDYPISDTRTPLEIAYQPERAEGDADRIQAFPDGPRIGKDRNASKGARLYFSVPLNPDDFLQLNHTSLNLGGPDFDMSWTGSFEEQQHVAPDNSVRVIDMDEAKLIKLHPHTDYVAPLSPSRGEASDDYSRALREQIYKMESVDPVTALSKRSGPARVSADAD